MSTWSQFPQMSPETLRSIRQTIDQSFHQFSSEYGIALEHFFDPLLALLIWLEQVFVQAPWMLVIAVVSLLVYLATKSWKMVIGVIAAFLAIGYFGMWLETMQTLSIITVCTFLAIGLGIPVGIWMARSDRVEKIITPILDVMQTMPSFVYLIPVVMLLGIGKVPGLLAVTIYALPPIIRLTNLGIRQVDAYVLEASEAYGCTTWQKLTNVQIPLALPSIFAGINQTIMLSLSMVVIASMIGVKGLGLPVLRAITNQYFSLGLLNGLAIVLIAIIFDRVSQQYGVRLQRHLTTR